MLAFYGICTALHFHGPVAPRHQDVKLQATLEVAAGARCDASDGALEQAGARAHDSPSPPRRCTIPTKPKTNATAATISAVGTASA